MATAIKKSQSSPTLSTRSTQYSRTSTAAVPAHAKQIIQESKKKNLAPPGFEPRTPAYTADALPITPRGRIPSRACCCSILSWFAGDSDFLPPQQQTINAAKGLNKQIRRGNRCHE